MEDKKVKVRILPLKGIGGYGNAGAEVWMSAAEAEMYIREGYVELISDDASTTPPSTAAPLSAMDEDHKIMKPARKRK